MGQIEKFFPPSFFDIMPHLMMHMVDQVMWLRPMYLHEMWPYERFMSILNCYVHNRAHPEGSMIERYCAEEVIKACQDYLREEDRRALGWPVSRHKGRLVGKGNTGRKTFIDKEYTQVEEAHCCVLQYLSVMKPFIEKHIALIRAENPGRSEQWIVREQKRLFGKWLGEQELSEGETLRRLAQGPSSQVTSW